MLDIDIVKGTETWLHSKILNSELLLKNFDIFRRDRTDTIKGGGAIICIKKGLHSKIINKGKDNESVFIRLNNKNKKNYNHRISL